MISSPDAGSGAPVARAVRARGLVKRFDGQVAIDGVDLDVTPGQIRGLLGRNGAGKTTLLRLLLGLVAPDEGSIELLGTPLAWPDRIDLEGVAGFVEEPRFYPYLSGRANLELLAELDGGGDRQLIESALERVGLAARSGDRVGRYSTGMRQRLGIAAALLRTPRLLLLDEPTSGLDPAGAREVAALLRELACAGVAVLLSSHLIGEVEVTCDAFTFLDGGEVVWSGDASAVRAQAPPSAYSLATSDDRRALELATRHPEIRAARGRGGEIELEGHELALDSFMVELGRGEIAVRRLEPRVGPLESMFFALTGTGGLRPAADHPAVERMALAGK
jgi:ABC-2 type transport system ATP-binding protein